MSFAVRLVLEQDLTVLLVSLALIPVATAAGVEPWAVTIALLATSVVWFLPFQTSSYMVARSASEDRLFSHEQARRFALAYAGLTLLGLALAVPYWRLLGVLLTGTVPLALTAAGPLPSIGATQRFDDVPGIDTVTEGESWQHARSPRKHDAGESSFPGPGLRKGVRAQAAGRRAGVDVPHNECALADGRDRMATDGHSFMVGESLVGDGNEVAHIDLIIGSKSGPAGAAFVQRLADQTAGHNGLLAVLAPNVPAKPDTVMFNKVTIKGAGQAVQMFGPAQAAVAKAVVDSVADGTIPKASANDLCVIVGVFIHWQASDNKKIYDYNYRATKESIARAMKDQPSVDSVVAQKDTAKHPFA